MNTLYNRILINYDNIDNLYMQKTYYSGIKSQCEIRMYSEGIILAEFDDDKECMETFRQIIKEVCEQNKNIVFTIPIRRNKL